MRHLLFMNFQNTGSLSLILIYLLYDLWLVYSIAKEVNVWIFPYLRLPQKKHHFLQTFQVQCVPLSFNRFNIKAEGKHVLDVVVNTHTDEGWQHGSFSSNLLGFAELIRNVKTIFPAGRNHAKIFYIRRALDV